MCNASVLRFLKGYQKLCQSNFNILEIGSKNINGTPRVLFQPLVHSYTGIDLDIGDGVDKIVSACELLTVFKSEQFDMVISTEMLEHCLDWRTAINQMKAVLKPSGYLFMTTRSPGFGRHCPPDYWRFTLDHFRQIFDDFDLLELTKDSESPGVFIAAIKPHKYYYLRDLNTIQPYPA